jgi:hypothetical protein
MCELYIVSILIAIIGYEYYEYKTRKWGCNYGSSKR